MKHNIVIKIIFLFFIITLCIIIILISINLFAQKNQMKYKVEVKEKLLYVLALDKDGNPVLSKLDEVSLKKIAFYTKGKYYQATETEFELKKVYDDILTQERELIYGKQFSRLEDQFQWFLIPAILIMFIELLKKERKQ